MYTLCFFVDTEPHPLIDFVSRIYKLVIEVVQHDPSVVPNLHPILSLIYPILQKSVPDLDHFTCLHLAKPDWLTGFHNCHTHLPC